jgi:hypothetical protein
VSGERNGLEDARELALAREDFLGPHPSPSLGRGYDLYLAGLDLTEAAVRWVHQGFEPNLDDPDDWPEPISDAFQSSWVSFLHRKLGAEGFRRMYRQDRSESAFAYQREWRAELSRLARIQRARIESEEAASRASYRGVDFHRGFNFAYSNSRENGYPTLRSRRSLEALRELGANAVALVPYGFSDEQDLTAIRRAGDSIRTESDESLRVAARDARELGLAVMLKPQLWVSYRVWPSGIDFETEADWERWFHCYRRWILPYAALAEELRVDVFCLGTELTRAALEHPDRFRSLIADVRRVYFGPLTYAANWYDEFEQVLFWDQLDLIGLDNYYPLARNPEAAETELRAGAAATAERIERATQRFEKPVLFTEAGFPSLETAGLGPPAPSERGPRDLARQALLYRITFETYWDKPWFAGVYWWKWFSDPDNAGPDGDVWTPRGKPAEHVIREWFTRAARPSLRSVTDHD